MKSHLSNNYKYFILIVYFILASFYQAYSQKYEIKTKTYQNLSWENFVTKVESDYGVSFFYKTSEIPDFKINIKEGINTLKQLLDDNLKPYNIYVSMDKEGNIFLSKEKKVITNLPSRFFKHPRPIKEEDTTIKDTIATKQDDFIKTSTEYIAKTIIVGTKEKGVYKNKLKLNGLIKNANTGEIVVDATIIDKETKKGTISNNDGSFELFLDKGKHFLNISSVNILDKQLKVNMLSDGDIEIWVEDKVIMLGNVEIRADKNDVVKGVDMGIENLSTKAVKNIPLVFGEKDIIKVALLLPGVQTVGEGSAGFNVRGSPTDQNMFYINNVPIYNTSHASGFFSAFNSDAVDEFTLYKSNIPVEHGGRISSIFDINAKQGRKDRTTASGGIGFITGRVLAEGPIQKDKSSFVVGLRSTYSDWAINMMTNNEKIKNSKANFIDGLTNLSFQLNPKNLLNVFAYYSKDDMTLAATNNDINYENAGASLNWSHYFNQNSFNLSFIHSSYKFYEESYNASTTAYSNSNRLQHSEVKAKLKLKFNNNHSLTMGFNSILYNNDKGKFIPLSSNNPLSEIDFGHEKGLESAIYLGDEWKLNDKLTLNGGLRFSLFSFIGPQEVNIYTEGLPKIPQNIIETINYNDHKFIKTYKGLDIRFSGRYLMTPDLSLKFSYNRMHQYMFVLSNTVSVSPNYKWKLIDSNTKPILGQQFSLGLFSNVFNNNFELSLETYYKTSDNIVEIKDGADLFSTKYFEQVTLQGDLKAYGVEFMLKKLTGRFSGWINYTYSLSEIKVDSKFGENRINNGLTYKSNFYKPHNLNLVLNYSLSRRRSISANFVYSTGRPITYASSYYKYGEGIRLNYSERNAYRLPDYFRLDLSFTLEGNLKKDKIAHGSWTFSVYNVLGRSNAYSVYFKEEDNLLKGYKLSIFASPIFSLTYNFKLGNYDN